MKRAPVSKGLRSQYWLNFLILVGGFLIAAISLTFLFNMSGALKDRGADYKPDQGGNFSRNPVDEEAPVTDHRTDEELPPEGDLESKPIDEGFLPSGFDESSCVSRYDPLLLRKATLRTSSQHLKSTLRKYETRHKRCAPYTEAYNKTVAVLGSSDATMASECKFNIWFPTGGLGNRILSLTSSFLYALLTDRVLLIDTDEGFSDLFCEPFPGGSWLLPLDFPLRERFKEFKKHSNDSFGELLRNNLIGNPTSSKPQPYLYAHVYSDYGDLDKRFYCDEEQSYVKDVPWTIMMSNVYFAPAFFTMPMFKQELDDMFPDKGTVFHFLGRYLFHPSNEVWGLVRRFHEAYLSEFDVKVGLQIRVFHHEEGIPFVNVMDEILSCTMNEGLLPRLHAQEQEPSSNRTTENSNKKKIAVLMTSLTRQFFEPLRRLFWQNATVTGESVAIHQPSFDEHQQTGDRDHDRRALAEIYLLSLTDKLVTSAASTFGYVAQGLGGLTPLMIPKSMNRTTQPCRRLLSMEPCFHMPPYYDCKTHQRTNTSVVEPYLLQCEDLAVGVKLVGDPTSTSTPSNP